MINTFYTNLSRLIAIKFIFILSFTFIITCENHKTSLFEEITLKYVKYFYDYEWEKIANFIHPVSIENFRAGLNVTNKILDSLEIIEHGNATSDTLLDYLRSTDTNNIDPNKFFINFMELALPSKTMKWSIQKITPQIRYLGYVNEGPDTVHVLYKIEFLHHDVLYKELKTMSLMKFDDEWRVLLPLELIKRMNSRLKTQRYKMPF